MNNNEKNLPKISIVTPSFNQAHFLESTIKSILSQEYPNLEYVIIDGGSTDGSVEIIKKYAEHLHYWCSEPDQGQYDAINKGFSHTTGEIMAWLNSDDMYYPWTLKTIGSIMSDFPEIEWLGTLYPGSWDYHGFWKNFKVFSGYSKTAFLDGCYIPWGRKSFGWIQQESIFWRRSLWSKIGGNLELKFNLAGDFHLWTQFFLYANLYGVRDPLGGFRRQRNQRTGTKEHYKKYVSEAEQSLAILREKTNWYPDKLRKIVMDLNLYKIPKIRSLTEPFYLYHGEKVVRKNFDSPDSFWQIEPYSFFVN